MDPCHATSAATGSSTLPDTHSCASGMRSGGFADVSEGQADVPCLLCPVMVRVQSCSWYSLENDPDHPWQWPHPRAQFRPPPRECPNWLEGLNLPKSSPWLNHLHSAHLGQCILERVYTMSAFPMCLPVLVCIISCHAVSLYRSIWCHVIFDNCPRFGAICNGLGTFLPSRCRLLPPPPETVRDASLHFVVRLDPNTIWQIIL